MQRKFLKRVFTNGNNSAIMMSNRITERRRKMAMTLKEILDLYGIEPTRLQEEQVYFSENGKSGGANIVYPYTIIQNGKESPVDKNIFILDMIELRKFMSPQKNNPETFYEKMINDPNSYKDPDAIADVDAVRLELHTYWGAMFDQLKFMVEHIKNENGLVVVPNVEYFKDAFNSKSIPQTTVRREFTAALKESLIHNYREAERLNEKKADASQKIQCSEEFNGYLKKLSEKDKTKGNRGK